MLISDRYPIFDAFSNININKNIQKVEEYRQFLDSLGDRLTRPQKGYNLHHIIPKVFFNKNLINTDIQRDDPKNLILLTPYEHFKAHVLLVAIFPSHHGLNSFVARTFKFLGKSIDDPDFEFTYTEAYKHSLQEIGRAFSHFVKERWANPEFRQQYIQMGKDKWADPEYQEKMSGSNAWLHSHKPSKGTKKSEETRHKMSQTRIVKGLSKGKNNPRYGKKWDDAHCKAMSECQKGENSHRWGIAHSKKTRAAMSQKGKERQRQKRMEKEAQVMKETMGFLF